MKIKKDRKFRRGKKRKILFFAILIIRMSLSGIQHFPVSCNSTDFEAIRSYKTTFIVSPGGDNGFKSGKLTMGSKTKSFAKRRTGKKLTKQSGKSPFVQSFTARRNFSLRPGNVNKLPVRSIFQPSLDPWNVQCGAAGPRSITIVQARRGDPNEFTKLRTYDDFEIKLTSKSEDHFTSKHGHNFGVTDILPPPANQKPTEYEQVTTRLNTENKLKVREEIKNLLLDTNSDIYNNVCIRGIRGKIYHNNEANNIVGIHIEGKFAGQVIRAQPISVKQLRFLRESKVLT